MRNNRKAGRRTEPRRRIVAGRDALVPLEAILFDKDGTLVDFFATWVPAYRAAAELGSALAGRPGMAGELLRVGGYDPDSGRIDPSSLLAGGTTAEICDFWCAVLGRAGDRLLAAQLHEAMDLHASRGAVAVGAGLSALLGRLRARGIALGMATMDSEFVARATADVLGLSENLVFLCGYDSGHGVKPGPGMVLAYCSATGLAPEQVMVVGDTDRDMGMARAAGAGLAVGVLSGAAPRARLAPLCDRILDDVFALENAWESLAGRRDSERGRAGR